MQDKILRYQEIEKRGLLGQLPQEKQDIWEEYKRRHPELNVQKGLTPEQQEQVKQIGIKGGWLNEDGSVKGKWVESDFVRKPVAVMQGISNASLNPVGYIARAAGMDTKPLIPKDKTERALERGAGQAYDFAMLGTLGSGAGSAGLLGKGMSIPSKISRGLLIQAPISAAAAGFGGGFTSGYVNPSNPYADLALNIVGGMAGNATLAGLKNAKSVLFKNKMQQVKNPQQEFAKALTRRDNVTDMKRGVQAGDEALREKANEFVLKMDEKIASHGKADPKFNKTIELPRMTKASIKYDKYMAKNGNKLLSEEDWLNFYKENPVAVDLLNEARAVNPSAFKGVPQGSIKEADYLKAMLRDAKGNAQKYGVPKADAAARAENSIKNLMETKAKGFRAINKEWASAHRAQELVEKRILQNARRIAEVEPQAFWSGLSSPISAAGAAGYFVDPSIAAIAGAGLLGKSALRAGRRSIGRAVSQGKTPLLRTIGEGFTKTGKDTTIKSILFSDKLRKGEQ
jgi:hypothetical protein